MFLGYIHFGLYSLFWVVFPKNWTWVIFHGLQPIFFVNSDYNPFFKKTFLTQDSFPNPNPNLGGKPPDPPHGTLTYTYRR